MGALVAVQNACLLSVSTDKGHSSSDGRTVVEFWIQQVRVASDDEECLPETFEAYPITAPAEVPVAYSAQEDCVDGSGHLSSPPVVNSTAGIDLGFFADSVGESLASIVAPDAGRAVSCSICNGTGNYGFSKCSFCHGSGIDDAIGIDSGCNSVPLFTFGTCAPNVPSDAAGNAFGHDPGGVVHDMVAPTPAVTLTVGPSASDCMLDSSGQRQPKVPRIGGHDVPSRALEPELSLSSGTSLSHVPVASSSAVPAVPLEPDALQYHDVAIQPPTKVELQVGDIVRISHSASRNFQRRGAIIHKLVERYRTWYVVWFSDSEDIRHYLVDMLSTVETTLK